MAKTLMEVSLSNYVPIRPFLWPPGFIADATSANSRASVPRPACCGRQGCTLYPVGFLSFRDRDVEHQEVVEVLLL